MDVAVADHGSTTGFGALELLARAGFLVKGVVDIVVEWAVGLSPFGVAARAIVFALRGWGIVVAGWFRDASAVGTTTSSLRILADTTGGGWGRWFLGVAAAGFVAYGFYEIIHARSLHIRLVALTGGVRGARARSGRRSWGSRS